ncbi:MAG: hypothetical protein M9936_24400 [Caldilinea sp.]|nr:hypothetical protein [Caldilinea sp.]
METATGDVRFVVGAISISHVFVLPTFSAKHDRRYGNRRYVVGAISISHDLALPTFSAKHDRWFHHHTKQHKMSFHEMLA